MTYLVLQFESARTGIKENCKPLEFNKFCDIFYHNNLPKPKNGQYRYLIINTQNYNEQPQWLHKMSIKTFETIFNHKINANQKFNYGPFKNSIVRDNITIKYGNYVSDKTNERTNQ